SRTDEKNPRLLWTGQSLLCVPRLSRPGRIHLSHRPGRRRGKFASEEASRLEGQHHRQRVRRTAYRTRTGPDYEGRALKTRTAAFHRLYPRAADAHGQRRVGQTRARSRPGDYAARAEVDLRLKSAGSWFPAASCSLPAKRAATCWRQSWLPPFVCAGQKTRPNPFSSVREARI